ncbi:MAG: RNA polymerase sigma factor [Ferrimicrobium sp.]|jgi:RNA polymerase sigma-70 factor (ECF subfamily)|uniref:Sigma-70 family RNA polymerase sigma factor n=1 Tax=Ferrimicrobium acidiphilum TaxID=121039 RepID=A0ABV3XZG6_9ACTN|nr:sigma-70 family RNA polymerase sigma factor [Ferrimicrobium sp.]MCL5973416.1 sigma-70 family RNA polymerase sigma factor [Actinomycetota bacterium]
MGSSAHVAQGDPLTPPKAIQAVGDLKPSFEEILKRTQRASASVAMRILGDAESVGDVLQDAYLNVFRSLERFRGDSKYETWVYRIVVNSALGHLRARNRITHRECSLEVCSPVVADVAREDPNEATAATVDLISLLDKVPNATRELLVMRYGMGYSVRMIAEATDQTEANVKVRLYRARKQLALLFAQEAALGGAEGANQGEALISW